MHPRNFLPVAAGLSLMSCGQIATSLNAPLSSEYSPLDGPRVNYESRNRVQPTGPSFEPGEWVETVMPNGTFFDRIPRGSAAADQVLPLATPMKVIATKGSFLKVELENGSLGFIPIIMVALPSNSDDTAPFLPPPPSSPLQRTVPSSLDSSPVAPLSDDSDSLIPPPSTFSPTAPSTPPVDPVTRNPNEVLIPTTAPPSRFEPPARRADGVIPPPVGADEIDEIIGIE